MSDNRSFLKRRRFLQGSFAMGMTMNWQALGVDAETTAPVRMALISDVHQDVIHDGPERLAVFLKAARDWQADAIMEMGDFCIPKEENRGFADLFETFEGRKFHILGNHDMDDGYTREQVLAFHGMPGRYYSFDLGWIHAIVLDGNDVPTDHESGYPSYIAEDQIEWLTKDLQQTERPCFVFSHQSLERPNCIRSQQQVRAVLENAKRADGSRKVVAAFNGHFHINHAREINGIPYVHINSASYYWVGQAYARQRLTAEIHARRPDLEKTVPYRDALFTLLEVDVKAGRWTLTEHESSWIGDSPQQMGQGYPGIDPAWVTPQQSAHAFDFPSQV